MFFPDCVSKTLLHGTSQEWVLNPRSDDPKGEVLFTALECCDAYEVLLGHDVSGVQESWRWHEVFRALWESTLLIASKSLVSCSIFGGTTYCSSLVLCSKPDQTRAGVLTHIWTPSIRPSHVLVRCHLCSFVLCDFQPMFLQLFLWTCLNLSICMATKGARKQARK